MTPPTSDNPSRDLSAVQRWFQQVITHPRGVEAGVDSDEARRMIGLGRDELERIVRRSKRLTASQRLGIYANAYYARLVECLRETFPVLCRAVGRDIFNGFAFGYLRQYPSRSYTLNRLADRFPRYLDETRPEDTRGRIAWPDFLIDLADLELTIADVFDGPGVEKTDLVSAERLAAIPPERFAAARLTPVICLTLRRYRYPVNGYYTAARRAADERPIPFPDPADQFIAVTRRDYIVRRYELTEPQFILLMTLRDGRPVGQAIEAAARATEAPDDRLAADLHEWFRIWTAERFFQTVEY